MRTKLFAGVAFAALVIPAAAMAQSTASQEFNEGSEVVVTGRADRTIGGVDLPNQPKAQVVLDSEIIQRQRPGQTINDVINLVPGVSFQNNDPYGSSGGGFRIRGFDSSRISQTLDGIPLNDSGNYAIYTNQQVDSEIIDNVSVNLGATDVDSPTASAVGGTVNLRTRVPGDELGAMFTASYGEYDYHRVFGMIDTGDITGMGTKAFASASWVSYDNPFNNYGRIKKQQYNARIYQDLGGNGDFISIAGHYNQARNNFFGSGPLRGDPGRETGTGSGNRFPTNFDEASYDVPVCSTDTPETGVVDATNSCGTQYDRRYNPSNTGNIRGTSRFTIADGLTLTVDPSYQYTKANGGGTVTGREGVRTINGVNYTGFIGGQYYFGRDLNFDGDVLDTCSTSGAACASSNANGVTLLAPSQTVTNRYMVISNLVYQINDAHRVRLSYTYDRARHRQTGETGFLYSNGEPFDVFPINDPITDLNGNVVQKRDRKSYAILNQVSGQYRGEFLENNLVLDLGLRVPFFKRDLNQNCFTTAANGNVDCVASDNASGYAAANPTYAAPRSRDYTYNRALPNVGLTYNITPQASIFASYAKGLSVPGTDTLYSALYFADGTEGADPAPETTDSFDLGLRYRSGIVTAQLGGYYIKFKNRIATAFDAELGESVSRNIGKVDRYGFDGSISVQPIREITAYVFGSYLNSEIQDDLQTGANTFLPTAGKQESGLSKWSFGGRLQGTLGPVELGAQVKYTGPRYINDINEPLVQTISGVVTEVFPAKVDGYTLVDLDARFSLAQFGLDKTFFQLNVSNLFNEFYVGYISGSSNNTSVPFVQFGAPRAVSGSIVIGF
ncbi:MULTISPECIES: TonB-dependent receptor [Sphingomonas]|uniref:TonB-dependent receptor n=1 Tax=Sphingomonas TaxID=13687 RepID=UPI000F7D7277|nr:TonB-dependent receptor [Sphingomonas sp. ABOLF]RSV16377.1 TonB-dependent receptor [Sphingomonas sp. ABOLF]GLK21346.1 TonB-dependent receptor [Microbacterium terregens]